MRLRRTSSAEYINFRSQIAPKLKAEFEVTHFEQERPHEIFEDAFETRNEQLNVKKSDEACLPNPEYVEFLKDIKDIVHWNMDYMLMKMNVFYLAYCFHKNDKI